ncbi:MAG: PsbP-related protein, partial [Candidatus Thermoplasmatota archaeon]|nr:PsbP-related protein [Candidatus Thermoplasmatota archaeon]
MKKQLVIVGIAVLLLVVSLCGCEEKSSENGDSNEPTFYTYENTEKGISIEYPATWIKQENPPQAEEILVLFTSQSGEPTKIGSLMISVLDLEDHMGMDWFKQAHIENLSILIPDFNIIYEDSSTLSGLPAYKIVFTFTQDLYTWRQLEIWTIKDNTLYLLVHQADQANHNEFIDTIDQMIESFKIIDNNEQDDGSSYSDFDKLIGTWTTDDEDAILSSVIFYQDGASSSSKGDGTFEVSDGELVTDYYDVGGGVYTFEYSFSDNDNTLTLTDVTMGKIAVYTKQTSESNGQDNGDFDKFIGAWGE